MHSRAMVLSECEASLAAIELGADDQRCGPIVALAGREGMAQGP